MTAAALVVLGLVLLVVLGAVLLLLQRLLRTLEGIEAAVWHVGEELRGGVGLRLGRSRATRPENRTKAPAPASAPVDIVDIG